MEVSGVRHVRNELTFHTGSQTGVGALQRAG